MADGKSDVIGIKCHHVGHDTPLIISSTPTFAELMHAVANERDLDVGQTVRRARRVTGLALATLKKCPSTAEAIVAKHGSKMGEFWLGRYDRAKREALGN